MALDHLGRAQHFDVLGLITAAPGMIALGSALPPDLPPAWAATATPDPVQILKIRHEEPPPQHPALTTRGRVTFAVPLDPRHVAEEGAGK